MIPRPPLFVPYGIRPGVHDAYRRLPFIRHLVAREITARAPEGCMREVSLVDFMKLRAADALFELLAPGGTR